jgi:hypothetical protein
MKRHTKGIPMSRSDKEEVIRDVRAFLDGSPLKLDVKSLDSEWYRGVLEESRARTDSAPAQSPSPDPGTKAPKP